MEAAGGVYDERVGGARFGGGHGVVDDGGGIGAGFLLDDIDAVTRGPDFELLDGGGTEGVGGAEDHAEIVLAEAVGELADAGGFAGAVHADDEDDARASAVGRGARGSRERACCGWAADTGG